jgi:hypothetical protein
MGRLFSSARQALSAVVSGTGVMVSLAADVTGFLPSVPWQFVAIGAFFAFAAVLFARILALTGCPIEGSVRLDRQHTDSAPMTLSIDGHGSGTVSCSCTLTGRLWPTEDVVLDDIYVLYYKPWKIGRVRWKWPVRPIAQATLGDEWKRYKGFPNGFAGASLMRGRAIELDKCLFSAWKERAQSKMSVQDVFCAELHVKLLVPPVSKVLSFNDEMPLSTH